jgi:hypothetical protein
MLDCAVKIGFQLRFTTQPMGRALLWKRPVFLLLDRRG